MGLGVDDEVTLIWRLFLVFRALPLLKTSTAEQTSSAT